MSGATVSLKVFVLPVRPSNKAVKVAELKSAAVTVFVPGIPGVHVKMVVPVPVANAVTGATIFLRPTPVIFPMNFNVKDPVLARMFSVGKSCSTARAMTPDVLDQSIMAAGRPGRIAPLVRNASMSVVSLSAWGAVRMYFWLPALRPVSITLKDRVIRRSVCMFNRTAAAAGNTRSAKMEVPSNRISPTV